MAKTSLVIHKPLPQETTPLLEERNPKTNRRSACINLSLAVVALYTVVIVYGKTEPASQPRPLSLWATTYTPPPKDSYKWPINESCQEKYIDRSSNNLCITEENLCSEEFNCPRIVMPQLNPHATLAGFERWSGENGTITKIPAKNVKICQREIFKTKVDFDKSQEKHPIPGETQGKHERIIPISSEGCVVDGNHAVVAKQFLNETIIAKIFNISFFTFVTRVKGYMHGCWIRIIPAEICHLRYIPNTETN